MHFDGRKFFGFVSLLVISQYSSVLFLWVLFSEDFFGVVLHSGSPGCEILVSMAPVDMSVGTGFILAATMLA